MMKTYYITTAIDYPNADPHIGHAYEKITADVFARWHRLKGEKVYFSYGLDEHGQKINNVAEQKGIKPQKWVDIQAKVFSSFLKTLDISNDGIIRTTDSKHAKFAQNMFQKVLDKGEIYKGKYKGNYCVFEETFYTDTQLVDGNCPECGRPTKVVSEDAYFFKMSLYQDKIVKHIEKHPKFIVPESRRNEILFRLKNDELRDLCVSRSSFDWGIPLPNDPDHIIYVWFDALLNYLSIIDYPDTEFWPADVQVIGKDILWFHAVIWPAMLMATNVKLPKTVYAHGFINDARGQAMSKSLGNVVDPVEMVKLYGSDSLRYYLMRIVPSGDDGNFSEKELVSRYNTELGNDLGNLIKRIQVLVDKYFEGKLKNDNFNDEIKSDKVFKEADEKLKDFQYHRALDILWNQLRKTNAYLNEKEPWKNEDNRAQVLYNVLESIRVMTHYLYPFIPSAAKRIAEQLNFKIKNFDDYKFGTKDYSFAKSTFILFPRIEFEEQETFPLNLKVGKIVDVKRVPDSDKLYVEKVNLGNKTVQIVSGLVPYYSEQDLMDKHVIIVTNLKKAKLRGVESEAMLLAAEKEGDVKLLLAPNTSPGGDVSFEGLQNHTGEITFDDFMKVKLKIKDKKVTYDEKILKTDKEDIEVDLPDGAGVR